MLELQGVIFRGQPCIPYIDWMVCKFSLSDLFLSETKLSSVSLKLYANAWGFDMFMGVDAFGSRGGWGLFFGFHRLHYVFCILPPMLYCARLMRIWYLLLILLLFMDHHVWRIGRRSGKKCPCF